MRQPLLLPMRRHPSDFSEFLQGTLSLAGLFRATLSLATISLVTLSLATLCLATASRAEVFVVLPDGTGDFATIQAALAAAAASGDVIELGTGTFLGDGNRDLDFLGKAVTVRSQGSDASQVVLDCQGSDSEPHRAFLFDSGEGAGSVLQAITITGAVAPLDTDGGAIVCIGTAPTLQDLILTNNRAIGTGRGGALSCAAGANPTATACRFDQNSAYQGGAVVTVDSGPQFIECEFRDNSVIADGGALYSLSSASSVQECLFAENAATFGGGLFYDNQSTPTITGSIFYANAASLVGGGIVFSRSTATVDGCTFVENRATAFDGIGGAAFWCSFQTTATVDNTIIALGQAGGGMICEEGNSLTLTCCNVFGNEGGDWVGELAGQENQNGNISVNPLFCEPELRDYTVAENSPCLPAGNSCGVLIGALGQGCGVNPVREASWGSIKAHFETPGTFRH